MRQNHNMTETVKSSRILYTPSQFAKNCLLYLQEIGTLQAQKPHISKRENLDSYLFFYVSAGSGTLFYENVSYELHTGDYVFIDCRKGYYHETSADNPWQLSWIHFHGPTASAIYEKYIERGGTCIFHPNHPEIYQSIYQNLFTTASGDSYVRDMEINTGLANLLAELMKDAWHSDHIILAGKRSDLAVIKDYLDQHYQEKIALDDLAQRYHINKFYLTRIFKDQFGLSINSYLLSVRITHAKSLLRFSDQTTDAIGITCGIGSGYYFSRVFKQVEGISPSEYRKKWRNK